MKRVQLAGVLALYLAAASGAAFADDRKPIASAPTVASAFSPGGALPLVLSTIRGAKTSIAVAAYSFTSKPISLALLDAHKRGVRVAVVVDQSDASKGYSAARFLANHGVPVRTNGRYSIQHNKYIVVDRMTVQTGSFNYTASASERNAENVLVVGNAPDLAATYIADWQRLWNEGSDLRPSF